MRIILIALLALGLAFAQGHAVRDVAQAIAADSNGAMTECPRWAASEEGFGPEQCIYYPVDLDATRMWIGMAFDAQEYIYWLFPWEFIPDYVMFRSFVTPSTDQRWSIIIVQYEPMKTMAIIAEFIGVE